MYRIQETAALMLIDENSVYWTKRGPASQFAGLMSVHFAWALWPAHIYKSIKGKGSQRYFILAESEEL